MAAEDAKKGDQNRVAFRDVPPHLGDCGRKPKPNHLDQVINHKGPKEPPENDKR